MRLHKQTAFFRKIYTHSNHLSNSCKLFEKLDVNKLDQTPRLREILIDLYFATMFVNDVGLKKAMVGLWDYLGEWIVGSLANGEATQEMKDLVKYMSGSKAEVNQLVCGVLFPEQRSSDQYLEVSLDEILEQLRKFD